jgi:hypothetical protein
MESWRAEAPNPSAGMIRIRFVGLALLAPLSPVWAPRKSAPNLAHCFADVKSLLKKNAPVAELG